MAYNSRASGRSDRILRDRAISYNAPRAVMGDRVQMQLYVNLMSRNVRATIGFEFIRTEGVNNHSGLYLFRLVSHTPYDNLAWGNARIDLEQAIQSMIDYTRIAAQLNSPDDKLQFRVDDPYPLHWSSWLVRQYEMKAADIFDLIMAILQSDVIINGTRAMFGVFYSRNMRVGGYCTERINAREYIVKKQAIIRITTRKNRNDCLFQCIYMFRQYPRYIRSQKVRESGASEIIRECGLSVTLTHMTGVDIGDIDTIADKINLNIIVIDIRTLIYLTQPRDARESMFVLYQDTDPTIGHFHFIKPDKVGSLWSKRRFCLMCMKGYNYNDQHPCTPTCIGCHMDVCLGVGKELSYFTLLCARCNLYFYDDVCLHNHKCNLSRCPDCRIIYKREKKYKHVCGDSYCRNCCKGVSIEQHECYIPILTNMKLKKINRKKIVYYDYETYTKDGIMAVALIVAMYSSCDDPIIFTNEEEFIDWIFQRKHRKYTFVAHNGARFDFHFIKRQMIKRKIKSKDIVVGNSIIYSCTQDNGKIRFIDSYRFVGIPLRSFPSCFGFRDMSKGYFPYTFLTEETLTYVGPMPESHHFGFDNMKPDERIKAMEWYCKNKNTQIDLMTMCREYCIDDVKVLRRGCELFQDMFLEISAINPFAYTTIASTCMAIYRYKFMPLGTIGLFRHNGKNNTKRERWAATFVGENYHSLSPIEIFDMDTNMVHIYADCHDSGCQECFKRHTLHPTKKLFMYEIHHNFLRLCDTHNCRRIYYACTLEDVGEDTSYTLNIRDAFFGGRVEPMKLHYKCRENERIDLLDYNSLYPGVLACKFRGISRDTQHIISTHYFPVGHGIHIENPCIEELSTYFGFVKCNVTCPEGLYIPLLPERRDGKLVFDLAPKIAATYTTPELMKAIQLGYVVTRIYDVLHFEEKSNTLFRDYIATFIKMKMEAGGWKKSGCFTDEDKAEFVRVNSEFLDIAIDPSAMDGDYNPGRFFVVKNCLNNLWGKFGQRDTFVTVRDTFTELDFASIAHNDKYAIRDIVVHDNCARTIGYTEKQEFIEFAPNTNVAIAAFTTAYGRLRLYEALELLDRRVLYMDTDSVFYVEDGTSDIVTGFSLGDLKRELNDHEYIHEFVSTGPKSYAYKTCVYTHDNASIIPESGKCEVKIKGFSLNFAAIQILNFDTLKEILFGTTPSLTIVPFSLQIDKRHNVKRKDWTASGGKRFRYTYDKRQVCEKESGMIDTIPFQ